MKASAERSGGAGVTGKKGKDEDRIASDPSRAGSLGQVESEVAVCNAPTLVCQPVVRKFWAEQTGSSSSAMSVWPAAVSNSLPGTALGSTWPLL